MSQDGAVDYKGRWRCFDSSRVDVHMRTPVWERLTRDLLLPLRLDAPAGPILGTIAGRRAGPVRQLSLAASAHFGVRTPDLAQGVGSEQCSIAFATAGRVEVLQYGRRAVLAPGQCAVYDTSDAFEVGSATPFGAEIVMFPSDALGLGPGRLAPVAARTIGDATTACLRRAVEEWTRAPTGMAEAVGELIADAQSHRVVAADPPRTDADVADSARRLIEARLADPRLGPDFIAALLGVSRRRLYYACAERIGPPAGYIRARRLDHAARLLRDRRDDELAVTEIAQRSGFFDAAHFSRLFVQKFGMSPSQWRLRASR